MKVIYVVEVELLQWQPFRILSFERDAKFKPEKKETLIQVAEGRVMQPRSFLYNLMADEYLVRLWSVAAENEQKALETVQEFLAVGWEERAAWVDGKWVYFGRKWYVPESLKCPSPHSEGAMHALAETLRENEEAPGEEADRERKTVEEAPERAETSAG